MITLQAPTRGRGVALLEDPLLNRGAAFTSDERDEMGLDGLLPPVVETIEQQAQRAYEALDRYGDDLARHVYLRSPSGHTTAATLGAGLLAWAVAHHRHSRVACWLAWAAAVVLAAAAGWSRVWLGMHWPTDVRGRASSW